MSSARAPGSRIAASWLLMGSRRCRCADLAVTTSGRIPQLAREPRDGPPSPLLKHETCPDLCGQDKNTTCPVNCSQVLLPKDFARREVTKDLRSRCDQ
jgi:hypothetical protein